MEEKTKIHLRSMVMLLVSTLVLFPIYSKCGECLTFRDVGMCKDSVDGVFRCTEKCHISYGHVQSCDLSVCDPSYPDFMCVLDYYSRRFCSSSMAGYATRDVNEECSSLG